ITDQPSYIVLDSPAGDYVVLSCFPPLVTGRGGLPSTEKQPAFAVGSPASSDRRVLILSSHSQFWNSAVVQGDADNWAFMLDTVRWLSEHKGKKRKHALFIVENKVVTNFDVPIGELPFPTRRMI